MLTMILALCLAAVCAAAPDNRGVTLTPDAEWTYKTVGGKPLKLSVFLPEGYATGMRFSAIVYFHGGSWKAGEAAWQFPDCAYWRSQGMVAVSADYRLKDRDGVQVPLECVKDAKSAVRFLREHAAKLKIDPDRIVVAGSSAGGQLAAATAMIRDPKSEHADDNHDVSCRPDAMLLYNPYYKCEEWLSPPAHVAPGLPPSITFVGTEDPVVTPGPLKAFHDALKAAGNASRLYIAEGGKHGFCNGRNPSNPYFHWSLELADRFLRDSRILAAAPAPAHPAAASPVRFEAHE